MLSASFNPGNPHSPELRELMQAAEQQQSRQLLDQIAAASAQPPIDIPPFPKNSTGAAPRAALTAFPPFPNGKTLADNSLEIFKLLRKR